MMPHPERCFLTWQLPWYPKGEVPLRDDGPGPWLKMFQNAREFLDSVDAKKHSHGGKH